MDSVLPRNKTTASTVERVLAASGVLSILAGTFIISYFNPVTAGFFPQCPRYAMTGLHCPGCVLTRWFHPLFQCVVLTAVDYNALLPFYAFTIGYLMISMILIAGRGRGLTWSVFKPAAMYGFVIVLLIFGVVRNLPFYPFTILAP